MGFRTFAIFLLSKVITSSFCFAETSDIKAIEAIDQSFQLVYQIKTALAPDAPKASYGSGFVIDEKGLLATNFHVVAHALHEPEKYKIYLVDGKEAIEGKVVNTDIINDLAIIKVDRHFPRKISISQEKSRVGERMYSLGLPEDLNKSVIEGNYNGVLEVGPYQRIQMSLPLNSGMSGGPTVNSRGELVGVNVSVLLFAQNLAFIVPGKLVAELMTKKETNYEKKSGFNTLDHDISEQLSKVESELMHLIEKNQNQKVDLSGYRIEKVPDILKCWRTTEDGHKKRWSQTIDTCYLDHASMIDHDRYAGTFRIKSRIFENKRLNAMQFWNLVANQIGDRDDSENSAQWIPDYSTRFSCQIKDVLNQHKVPMRLTVCLNGYVKMPKLYELSFNLVTTNPGRRALLIDGYYAGFSKNHLMEILKRSIDGIELL